MKAHLHLSDLLADELLLDRVAARADVGSEPVAALLTALSRHADSPLRPLPPIRRLRRHRALTALTALVVGASGVGVAAAVNQSGDGWGSRDSLRMTQVEAGGATEPSSPPLHAEPAAPSPLGAVASVGETAGRILLQAPEAMGRATASQPGVTVRYAATPAASQPGASSARVAEATRVSALQAADSTDHGATKESPGRSKAHAGDPARADGEMMMLTAEPEPTPVPTPAPRPSFSAGRSDAPRGAQALATESERLTPKTRPTAPDEPSTSKPSEPAPSEPVPPKPVPPKEPPLPSDASLETSGESSHKPEVDEAPPPDTSTRLGQEHAATPSEERAEAPDPIEAPPVEPGS